MVLSDPKSTSTPKTIRARRPIRPPEDILSPIENKIPEHELKNNNSDSEEVSIESQSISEDEEEENKQNSTTKQIQSKYNIICYFLIILIPAVLLYWYPDDNNEENRLSDIEKLQKKYSSQGLDFWINIRVAVNDVRQLNQPKSIIFLYKSETTMDNILKSISEYASANICNSAKPIIVHGSYLQNNEILEDYGTFIANIGNKLNKQCVVVIKNLEEVPGKSAQAFHTLCDEYSPFKEHALFLFTFKVDSFPEKMNIFVGNKLRELWKDLHNDKFFPLYTRISTFILQVKSE